MSEYADDLRSLVRDLAERRSPGDVWPSLVEAGIPEVGLDEASGDVADLAMCVEELGRASVSTPLVEHAVAGWALGECQEAVTTVAAYARFEADTSTVTGRADAVPWTDHAERALLIGEDAVALVSLRGPGVDFVTRRDVAGTALSAASFTRHPMLIRVSSRPENARERLRVLRTASLLGSATAAFGLTRDHVQTRHQFGAPLVRIPAVANNLAVMRTELILARTALERALSLTEHQASGAAASIRTARVLAGRCATEVARLAHQLHGAIGVTEESALHRCTRLLWAGRDADLGERDEAIVLGKLSVEAGEDVFWDELTAPDW